MMSWVILLGLQVLIGFYTTAQAVLFEDCGSTDGFVNSVHIQDCSPTESPCSITRKSVSFSLNFTTNHGIYDYISSKGTARRWGLRKTIFSRQNICNVGLTCPIVPEMNNVYSENINIPSWAPKGRAVVQWQLTSGDKVIVCIDVAIMKE